MPCVFVFGFSTAEGLRCSREEPGLCTGASSPRSRTTAGIDGGAGSAAGGSGGTPGGAVGTPGGAVGTPGGAVGTPGGAVGTPGGAVGTPGGAVRTPGGAVRTPGGTVSGTEIGAGDVGDEGGGTSRA